MTEISFALVRRPATKTAIRVVFATLALPLVAAAGAQQQTTPVLHPANQDPSPHPSEQKSLAGDPKSAGTPILLNAMTTELNRAFTSLGKQESGKQLPPYFLSYSVSDAGAVVIRAQAGALVDSSTNRVRIADVQLRIGDPKLDNTHGTHRASAVTSAALPLNDDREALGRSLWLATNAGYGKALDSYMRVKTERTRRPTSARRRRRSRLGSPRRP